MSPKQVAKNISKPSMAAWIAAVSAMLVCIVTLVSHASAPYQKTLDDHEKRIRQNEQMREEISAINAKLDILMQQRSSFRIE